MTILTKEMADKLHSIIDKLSGGSSKHVAVIINVGPQDGPEDLALAEKVRNAIARLK